MNAEKLHPFHVGILIYMLQSGVVLFSLPRVMAETFGTNGWMVLPLFLFVSWINIWLISRVFYLGNGESVFSIINSFLPPLIRYPLYLIFAIKWATLAVLVAKHYVFIIQILSFPTTPTYIILGIILFCIVLFTINDIYNIVKGTTILFLISITTVLLGAFLFEQMELNRYTPFLLKGGEWELTQIIDIYLSFIGYEIALFLFPYVNKGKSFFRAVYGGSALTCLVYLYTCILSFGFYSFEQLKRLLYPTLQLFSYVEFPFLTRVESLVFSIFLFKVIVTSTLFLWIAKKAMEQILPKKVNEKWIVGILAVIGFLISLRALTIQESESMLLIVGSAQIVVAFFIPTLLILGLKIKKKNKGL